MSLTNLVIRGTTSYRLIVLQWASCYTDTFPKDGISEDRTKNLHVLSFQATLKYIRFGNRHNNQLMPFTGCRLCESLLLIMALDFYLSLRLRALSPFIAKNAEVYDALWFLP